MVKEQEGSLIMEKSNMNEQEQSRLLALYKRDGGVQEGDKCPMDGCRGILQEGERTLFNPNVDPPMFCFRVFECDKKRCKFTGLIVPGESARIEEWRKSAKPITQEV